MDLYVAVCAKRLCNFDRTKAEPGAVPCDCVDDNSVLDGNWRIDFVHSECWVSPKVKKRIPSSDLKNLFSFQLPWHTRSVHRPATRPAHLPCHLRSHPHRYDRQPNRLLSIVQKIWRTRRHYPKSNDPNRTTTNQPFQAQILLHQLHFLLLLAAKSIQRNLVVVLLVYAAR